MKKSSESFQNPFMFFLLGSKKRGVSAIITAVLIILITIAAIGIIWMAIVPLLKMDTLCSDISSRVSIDTSKGYTYYNSVYDVMAVQVKRNPGGSANLSDVRITISFGGGSGSKIVPAPGPGQARVYLFNLSNFEGEPTKVSVAPIFSKGRKKTECPVSSFLEAPFLNGSLSDGDYILFGACVSDGDCDDGNDCTSDSCGEEGECVYSLVTNGLPCLGGTCQFGVCVECYTYPFLGRVGYWSLNDSFGFAVDSVGDNDGSVFGNTRLLMHFDDVAGATSLYDDAVAYWKFDDTGLVAVDESVNGNDGTVVGGVTVGVDGEFGSAYEFDGVDGYVEVGDDDSLDFGTGDFTVCNWFKYNTANGQQVWSKRIELKEDMEMQIAGNQLIITTSYGESKDWITVGNIFEGVWYYSCVVRDNGNVSSYVDGDYKNSTFNEDNVSTSSDFYIGKDGVADLEFFNGSIDQVAIWDKALTPLEISEIYREGLVRDETAYRNNGRFNDSSDVKVVSGVSGLAGDKALEFDGVDDYVEVDDGIFTVTQSELTLSSWVYINEFNLGLSGGDTSTPLISSYNNYDLGNGKGYMLRAFHRNLNGENTLSWKFNIMDGGLGKSIDCFTLGVSAFEADYKNKWINIVGVFKGDDYIKLYIGGQECFSDSAPSQMIPDLTSPVWVGRTGVNPGFLNGSIDEVAIYSRALTATEIGEHYDEKKAQFVDWGDGQVGGAMEFDGVDDYVDLGTADSLNVSNSTLSAWVKINSFSTDDNVGQVIASSYAVNLGGAIFYLNGNLQGTGALPGFRMFGGIDPIPSALSSENLLLDKWYHIVGTYDGTNINIYTDGDLKDSRLYLDGKGFNQFIIGKASWYDGHFFNGSIDEVSIWSRALSKDEIEAIYNLDKGVGICSYLTSI